MTTRIKKTALFTFFFGLLVLGVTGYFGFRYWQTLEAGEPTIGTVSRIISRQDEDGTQYKPEISYRYQGEDLTYVPGFSSSINTYRIGDQVELRVSDLGIAIAGFHQGLLGFAFGGVFGFIFALTGLMWFLRHMRRYDEVTRLKRFGRRVTARFVRKDTTSYKINNQHGTVIYVQEEGGEGRMFETKPIFSDFSIKWLEEHAFDVYVDPSNDEDYYIDLDKHFGEPEPHPSV